MERGRLREQRLDAREEVGRRFRKDVDLRKWSAARTCARAHVRIERFQAVGEEVAARGPGMREDRTLAAPRRVAAIIAKSSSRQNFQNGFYPACEKHSFRGLVLVRPSPRD